MKEMILVRENAEITGTFSERTLMYSPSWGEGITIEPGSTNLIETSFTFEPLYDNVGFIWELDISQAKKGFVLQAAVAEHGIVSVVLTNLSDKAQVIDNGEPLLKVSFISKSVVRAVDASKARGVIDLKSKED